MDGRPITRTYKLLREANEKYHNDAVSGEKKMGDGKHKLPEATQPLNGSLMQQAVEQKNLLRTLRPLELYEV